MPLAFRTDKTVPLWLDIDDDLDRKVRPTFLARYVSEADKQRMNEILDAETEDSAQAAREALAIAISGWRNMPAEAGEYAGADSLARLRLTFDELAELLGKVNRAVVTPAPFTGGRSASP